MPKPVQRPHPHLHQRGSTPLEFDQVQRVAGENQQANLVPAAAIVPALEVRPGPERGRVGNASLTACRGIVKLFENDCGAVDVSVFGGGM